MNKHWIQDQVAIVCGGGSGIGRAIVLEAARNGAKVVIADIQETAGRETLELVRQLGATGTFIPTDVTDPPAIAEMARQASELGPIKYLANSAGLQTYGTAETTTEKLWDDTLDVNLKSMFLVCQQLIPKIRENGGGGIVNISSVQGLRCQKNVLAYATSKAAVIGMTRSMGLDHAAEGIYVNCICPGAIDTPLLRYGAAQHGELQTILKEWGDHHPIGRIGQPVEIARTAMFLWSPDSNFIVGQAIVADGGLGSIIL
ncbi:SDR family NAD(P)-dependent oxidoreductase [Flavilitoribacter nigricans]|uniref:Short-chain dehydrogenase n=1 Tax=Flavilitoribacter nigricans (strain ATCC 23147 / DSM 23189 / NBRC 102662 / NCIMB 1420 / SS-2) TaxID=1122177 RepID=A0A2D0NJN7_FLAN2|nr:SDR family oxidoreductase [Flavilitoribacter nigricans]PHN08648.1 short-chain dehydrogenase [Flavilitoribacter nigricans DSM 23189 = NBRC 102662]